MKFGKCNYAIVIWVDYAGGSRRIFGLPSFDLSANDPQAIADLCSRDRKIHRVTIRTDTLTIKWDNPPEAWAVTILTMLANGGRP